MTGIAPVVWGVLVRNTASTVGLGLYAHDMG